MIGHLDAKQTHAEIQMHPSTETSTPTPPSTLSPTAIPCPKCEYDLRAQTEPRCTECGYEARSFEELHDMSRRAEAIKANASSVKARSAAAAVFGLSITGGGHILFLVLPEFFNTSAGNAVRYIAAWAMVATFGYGGLLALRQLGVVIAGQFNRRTTSSQRRTLLKSIPLLLMLLIQLPAASFLLYVLIRR